VFVNHEAGRGPFPYVPANPTAANGENDFDNSQVSRLILNQHSAGVLDGSFMIDSSAGYQRFCSNYLATAQEGFSRDILLTNEESTDWFLDRETRGRRRSATRRRRRRRRRPSSSSPSTCRPASTTRSTAWGPQPRERRPAPGFDDLVVLSGDDTFTSGPLTGVFPAGAVPAQSQLYWSSHRRPTRCSPTRAICGRSSRTRPA
jgi:hypothetical protein